MRGYIPSIPPWFTRLLALYLRYLYLKFIHFLQFSLKPRTHDQVFLDKDPRSKLVMSALLKATHQGKLANLCRTQKQIKTKNILVKENFVVCMGFNQKKTRVTGGDWNHGFRTIVRLIYFYWYILFCIVGSNA